MDSFSTFSKVPMGKKDAIFGLHEQFVKDSDARKIDLTLGAYRDEKGESFIFPSVKKAQKTLISRELKMDYSPIIGNVSFIRSALKFVYGNDNTQLKENRIAAIQTLSGTGALRLAFDLLKKFFSSKEDPVYISTPTYANHIPVILASGFRKTQSYAYYKPQSNSLDFEKMHEDLSEAKTGSIVLLQAVAHNPTGTDPSKAQWRKLSKLFKSNGLVAVFDNAYQGFASGDPDNDAFSIRQFAEDGNTILVCQSFAKNFGLYGHRLGCLSVITKNEQESARVESQLKLLARSSYSNPPIHGARVVDYIFGDKSLAGEWRAELKMVSDRMVEMRGALKSALEAHGSEKNWGHLSRQIGMFLYTGLSPGQVECLRDEWHVYGTNDGRISVPALNSANLDYVAEAIHRVTSREDGE